jgi:hypothetical protein
VGLSLRMYTGSIAGYGRPIRISAIVVIDGVDVVSRLRVILRLPCASRLDIGRSRVVTAVGPFVFLHVRVRCRAKCRNQLLEPVMRTCT